MRQVAKVAAVAALVVGLGGGVAQAAVIEGEGGSVGHEATVWVEAYFEARPPVPVPVEAPVVLPALVCDEVPDGWSEALRASGWSAERADAWGEALMSPDGRVVVTFAC
jgi:hypothetical protein